LAAVPVLQNLELQELRKTVDLVVVLEVIQEQKVQELQALLAKVMTVVPQRDREMAAEVVLELQAEMEIVQTAVRQHAQVE
jgi:pyridoxine 5'-phosphate synthase PdxJ